MLNPVFVEFVPTVQPIILGGSVSRSGSGCRVTTPPDDRDVLVLPHEQKRAALGSPI